MFIKLFSIEWTRLTRRALFWVTLLACAWFIGYNQQHFYTANMAELLNGDLKMPGFSFDLASSLDQILLIAQPMLVIMAAVMIGSDYSQRTNQHWLMRNSRSSSLLTKFVLLVLVTFILVMLALLIGSGIGWFYKTYTYNAFSLDNVNWAAVVAAPFYMTLVAMPAIVLVVLVTLASRSSFVGILFGLGYTQFLELLLTGIFYSANWAKWIMRNLTLSATFLLNEIGNKTVDIPARLLAPQTAFMTAALYTLIFFAAALWLHRRQDVGG